MSEISSTVVIWKVPISSCSMIMLSFFNSCILGSKQRFDNDNIVIHQVFDMQACRVTFISIFVSTQLFSMITWARFHTLTFTRKYSTFFLLSYDWKHLYCSSKRNFHFGSLRNSLCERSYDNLFDLRLKTQLFPRSNPPDGGLTPDQI